MNDNKDIHRYDDIINLPYHQSATRPHMSNYDRAAQFSPFAALTGHDEAIKETARLTDRKIEIDEYTKDDLNIKLQIIDDNPALFVSLKTPHERLKIGGIETRLREFGKQLGLHKVHPHKFRRTLATMAIDKGMPIEQLQQLLGHRKIDTTLQYAMVKQSNVKIAHRKYIG